MTGRIGKTRNIFLVWLVWPFLTLGIYHLVWWYKINRETQDLDRRIEVSPALSVLAITVGGLIIVPPFVSVYRAGDRIARMQISAGQPATCSPVLGLIASFCFGLHALYYQYELNRTWEYLGAPEGTVITLPDPPDHGLADPGQRAA